MPSPTPFPRRHKNDTGALDVIKQSKTIGLMFYREIEWGVWKLEDTVLLPLILCYNKNIISFIKMAQLKTLPETCGQAMEVPLMVLDAVSLVGHALVMDTPGAKRSVHSP